MMRGTSLRGLILLAFMALLFKYTIFRDSDPDGSVRVRDEDLAGETEAYDKVSHDDVFTLAQGIEMDQVLTGEAEDQHKLTRGDPTTEVLGVGKHGALADETGPDGKIVREEKFMMASGVGTSDDLTGVVGPGGEIIRDETPSQEPGMSGDVPGESGTDSKSIGDGTFDHALRMRSDLPEAAPKIIGKGTYTNASESEIDKRMGDDFLVPMMCNHDINIFADFTKAYLNQMIWQNVAGADNIMTGFFGVDPTNKQWQRQRISLGPLRNSGTYGNMPVWQDSVTNQNLLYLIGPLWDALTHLQVGNHAVKQDAGDYQAYRMINPEVWPAGPNRLVSWSQQHTYRARGPGVVMAATNAIYEFSLNIADGVIIIYKAYSPRDAIIANTPPGHAARELSDDELPVYTHLSDFVYSEWYRQHQIYSVQNPPVLDGNYKNFEPFVSITAFQENWLNYIFIKSITGPDASPAGFTLRMIKACLVSRGIFENIPTFNHAQQFGVGHWCFDALLATSQGRWIAFFLAQHKTPLQLGHKIVDWVTIFRANDPPNHPMTPTLVWHVADIPPGANLHAAVALQGANQRLPG